MIRLSGNVVAGLKCSDCGVVLPARIVVLLRMPGTNRPGFSAEHYRALLTAASSAALIVCTCGASVPLPLQVDP